MVAWCWFLPTESPGPRPYVFEVYQRFGINLGKLWPRPCLTRALGRRQVHQLRQCGNYASYDVSTRAHALQVYVDSGQADLNRKHAKKLASWKLKWKLEGKPKKKTFARIQVHWRTQINIIKNELFLLDS